jgi:hypothetical protein
MAAEGESIKEIHIMVSCFSLIYTDFTDTPIFVSSICLTSAECEVITATIVKIFYFVLEILAIILSKHLRNLISEKAFSAFPEDESFEVETLSEILIVVITMFFQHIIELLQIILAGW